ncbi:MAG TPA: hypothetical protein VN749_06150 [Candidatus Eisenbacteria bacterium]|jgi:hypothetical protein|nr:hypothetical protein [Candidatus Eisenbacteria bacterium]
MIAHNPRTDPAIGIPARSRVNASTLPLLAAPHDPGPMWIAIRLSYDFCIHDISPV